MDPPLTTAEDDDGGAHVVKVFRYQKQIGRLALPLKNWSRGKPDAVVYPARQRQVKSKRSKVKKRYFFFLLFTFDF